MPGQSANLPVTDDKSTHSGGDLEIDVHQFASRLQDKRARYLAAKPYPHIVIDDFLPAPLLKKLVSEFPAPNQSEWTHYRHINEDKLGKSKREEFPPTIGAVIDAFNSPTFVAMLSKLTGIEGLHADPMLEGGGMHQTERGGFLNMHADFTMHHYHSNWRRRLNLILYLNPAWDAKWGGALELWDREMKACVEAVQPIANRVVIFNTDDTSYHGYPDPITPPEGTTRRSLALYYFTDDTTHARARSTNYRPRPTDGRLKRALMWADNQAIHQYSRVKNALGISDDLVSRILAFLSRKR